MYLKWYFDWSGIVASAVENLRTIKINKHFFLIISIEWLDQSIFLYTAFNSFTTTYLPFYLSWFSFQALWSTFLLDSYRAGPHSLFNIS